MEKVIRGWQVTYSHISIAHNNSVNITVDIVEKDLRININLNLDNADLCFGLDKDQLIKLTLYIKANVRMVECMNVAMQFSRKIREEIDESILIPGNDNIKT